MAQIKKIEYGADTIYPATIPQAVVDHVSGKTVREELDEKADQTELDQLAGDATAKMTNTIANSDFSQEYTGWDTTGVSSRSITGNVLTITSTLTYRGVTKTGLVFNGTDIYYISTELNSDVKPTTFQLRKGTAGGTINMPLDAWVANTWQKIAIRTTVTADHNGIGLFLAGTANIRNWYVINLSQVFGSGNEPTKTEFELLLNTIATSGWEGILTIPQQKLMQWEWKMIKQNRNAIVALGGTII